MNWILDNIEWIFSGIGLPLISIIVFIFLIFIGLRKVRFKIKIDATFSNDEKINK